MKITKTRFIKAILIFTLLSPVFAAIAGYLWIAAGERNINFALPYISKLASNNLENISVSASDAKVRLSDSGDSLVIKIDALEIDNSITKNRIATISTMLLEYGFSNKNGLQKLSAKNAIIKTEHIPTIESSEEISIQEVITSLFSGQVFGSTVTMNLENIIAYNKLSTISIPRFVSERDRNEITGEGILNIDSYGKNSSVRVSLASNIATTDYAIGININNLMPAALSEFAKEARGYFIPFDGQVKITGKLGKDINDVDFILNSSEGVISSEHFSETTYIESSYVEGKALSGGTKIFINKLAIGLEDNAKIEASGSILNDNQIIDIDANAKISNLPTNNLAMYWPAKLVPLTRKWVTTNITEGEVKTATARIKTGRLDKQTIKKSGLPDSSLKAEINVSGATVHYYEDLPNVKDVSGVVSFTGNSMKIDVISGLMYDATKVKGGFLEIPDLHSISQIMTIDLNATSNMREVAQYLSTEPIGLKKTLNLQPSETEGDAELNIKLSFPLSEKEHGFNYTISANVKNAIIPKVLSSYDITNSDIIITVDNKLLTIEGDVVLNTIPLRIKLEATDYQNKDSINVKHTAIGMADASSLAKLGAPSFEWLRGKVGFESSTNEDNKNSKTSLKLDLTNSEITLDSIGFIKPSGKKANLSMTLYKNDNETVIEDMLVEGDDISIKGNAKVDNKTNQLKILTITKADYGVNDFAFVMMPDDNTAGAKKVSLTANTLDFTPYLKTIHGDGKDKDEDKDPIQISGTVKTLISSDNSYMEDVKLDISCGRKICDKILIQSSKDRVLINPVSNQERQLSIKSSDAGNFMKFMGFYDNLKSGELTIDGKMDAKDRVEGKLIIRDFRVVKAPILAKLISLASITGILDGLNSTGISFTRLDAPFSIDENGKITISDMKCAGNSVGLTAKGTIDKNKDKIDIGGTLIPLYALNTMVGKTPIIGELLSGGEGGGVFATNFSMRGSYEDPTILVNPLSTLTPGFLRGIFGIFSPQNNSGEQAN